ncbi:ABC-2 type transport system ATP-binding protein [Pelagirhabdus alkalitolerans]|uniref:ABC-2 type transport system ATP-binding protein n=1 Tax=Pelagirhabdus alkalitolerans TaxID=1612202 RepID=A0A1G6INW8_9BACI|nr:ABC transporter ATP-binding protein [Pelagirhabdus alkalitolerans]SDC08252.1 ABC-2 type transport system ATP-binding protein [Pelagirhabdus alkalitolerans]
MLVLRDVSKSYVDTKKAVDSLSLEVKKGEIIGFIGPNGAGKTTTLKMMTGIIQPTKGSIKIAQEDIADSPVEAKKNFAYVPDQPTVFDSIIGIDYLNFMADMYDVSLQDRKNRIETFTEAFQIDHALTQKIHAYSHGMRQKLLIVGALLSNPKLFILDEPMVGLDPHSAKVLKDLMKEHCQKGGTVFFSSHGLDVVEDLCDRVAIIHKGKLMACDKVEAIKKRRDTTLEEVFLEMTKDA